MVYLCHGICIYLAPNVNSTKVEKPCTKLTVPKTTVPRVDPKMCYGDITDFGFWKTETSVKHRVNC